MRLVARLAPSLSVLCVACAAMSATTTASPTREATPKALVLPFAWPAGSSAIVTEEVLKNGKEAKLRYRIDVGARDGGGLRVQIKDLKFIELEAFDLTDPKHAAMIEALERQTAAMLPSFLVTAEGEFEGVTDYEKLLELVLQLVPEDRRDEASTLLPLHCESEEATTLVIQEQAHGQIERHSHQFEWTLPGR